MCFIIVNVHLELHSKSLHILFFLKTNVNASNSWLQNLPDKRIQNAAIGLCMFLNMSFSGALPQLMCAEWDSIFQKLKSGSAVLFFPYFYCFFKSSTEINDEGFLSTALIHSKWWSILLIVHNLLKNLTSVTHSYLW